MRTLRTLLLAALTTLAMGSGASAMADTLKMGMEGAHPPFSDQDDSGNPVGFDVEIGNALCAKMKVTCEVVTTPLEELIPALDEHRYDFVISSLSITDERAQQVDFTTPYYTNKLQFVGPQTSSVPADSKVLQQAWQDKRIGAQRGTLAATWLAEHWGPTADIRLYDTIDDAYKELANGNIVAVLADKYVSYEWLKSEVGQRFEFKGDPVQSSDKVGIAVRKNDPLRDRLNAALKEVIEDGTYKKINDKYFPFSIL